MRYLRAFYFREKLRGKELGRVEFAPVTIFCGGNGSGKTTILNYIAQNIFNKYLNNDYFRSIEDSESYIRWSEAMTTALWDEMNSRIEICDSGDKHDDSMCTDEIHAVFETDENDIDVLPFKTIIERSDDILLRKAYEDTECSDSEWIETNRCDFEEYNLCILDAPELCLDADKQLELVKQIEECSYLYRVQFIIATTSPIIASVKEALIYDIDISPVRTVDFKSLSMVKKYLHIILEASSSFV